MSIWPHRFDFSHSLRVQLTPLRGPKIVPILKADFGWIVISI
jgi:hypothetical protein